MPKTLSAIFTKLILGLAVALILTPAALAAGETYHWKDTGQTVLVGEGGSFQSPVEIQQGTDTASTAVFESTYPNGCPGGADLKLHAEIPLSDYQKTDPEHITAIQAIGCSVPLSATSTVAATTTGTPGPTQNTASAQSLKTDGGCKAQSLGWIVCPVYHWLLSTIEDIETGVILPFLKIDPLPVGQNSSVSYKVWSAVKTLSDLILVVVFLVLTFAHTASIDSYSVKKLLPRLVAAAVFIQFSYVLVGFGIDLANIIGAGIGQIVLQPIQGIDTVAFTNLTGGLGIAGGIAGLFAAAGSVLSGSILIVLVGAFFTVLLVFVTLVARQILITFLLIMGPLAFVAWCLPNTEHLFKLWHKSLTRLLLMYPLIVVLFASGKIFGAITASATPGGNGFGNDSLRSLVSIVANLVPLFLIPITFRLAGAALSSAHNLIRVLHGGTKVAAQNSGTYERLKTRTQQRRTELAAGQGVNIKGLGTVGRNRAVAQLGRGAFTGYGSGSNAKAMADFARERSTWDKRLEDEGFTYEGLEILSKGTAHGERKLQDAIRTGDRVAQANLRAGLSEAKRYINVSAARTAALKARGKMGVIDADDRTALLNYTGDSQPGQLIARQSWTSAREGARKGSVHLAFTDVNGNLNAEELRKFVIKQNLPTWANYSKDAYEVMSRPTVNVLGRMAADSQQRELLKNLLGPRGAAPEQQVIIRQVLAAVPPPPPPPPPI